MTEDYYKCVKCRLGTGVTPQPEGNESLIFVSQDPLPEWIQQKVEECGWTKTKLHCPSCGVRIGGIDFVSGIDPPIHLIRSKVDRPLGSEAREELERLLSSRAPEPGQSFTLPDLAESNTDRSSSDEASMDLSSSIESDESEFTTSETTTGGANSTTDTSSFEAGIPLLLASSSESSESSSSREDLSVETGVLSKHQKNKLRLRRRRIEKMDAEKKKKSRVGNLKEQKIIQNIMDAEPELDDIDPSLICPVCLDLLYEPHKVDPCKHVFCEPCLRRLGSKNAMNTSCPMCRQRIAYCEAQRDMSKTIREAYHSMHMKRKKFERSTNVFSLPLPWRPGWANLISGRAMGGNRLPNETNAEIFRQLFQQLPYYIPPVFIANLINLLFFICLLGAVEIVPLLFTLVIGRGPTGMSSLSKTGVSPMVEPPPMVSVNKESMDVEMSTPIEDLTGSLMSDVLQDEDDSSSPLLGEVPEFQTFAVPEAASPAMDATFYYIICTMSLLAAAFGNFLIIQQQPLMALIPHGTFLDRLYNHAAFGHHFQRFSDLFLIVSLSCIPVILLPLVLPSSADMFNIGVLGSGETPVGVEVEDTRSWLRKSLRSALQSSMVLHDYINSILTFQNLVCLAIVYYVTCTFFNYRGIGAN